MQTVLAFNGFNVAIGETRTGRIAAGFSRLVSLADRRSIRRSLDRLADQLGGADRAISMVHDIACGAANWDEFVRTLFVRARRDLIASVREASDRRMSKLGRKSVAK
jgi:hypothetical protein